jgi:hypothetical protein
MKPLNDAAACTMKWLATGNMAGVSEDGIGSADASTQAAQCLQLCWLGGASELHRVREHIAKHGIDVGGMTVGESLKAMQGTEVLGMMAERAYTNKATGETTQENVLTSFSELQ